MFLTMQCTAAEATAHPDQCGAFSRGGSSFALPSLTHVRYSLPTCTETFNVVLLTFVACASIGYSMCAIVSSVLDSIVSTIFVCFAEVRPCCVVLCLCESVGC